MNKQILFFQGGGDGGYEADKLLVFSLERNLGEDYKIDYPELESDESIPDFGWTEQIQKKILSVTGGVILVGHSLGASMLLKYLSENAVPGSVTGVFLISTPFWSGSEDWKKGLKLQENFAKKLPVSLPVFFYHCEDDETAPFAQFDHYRKTITQATFREMKIGGHQLNNDLTIVAQDIRLLG